jgi:hypothetical protein
MRAGHERLEVHFLNNAVALVRISCPFQESRNTSAVCCPASLPPAQTMPRGVVSDTP